MIGPTIRAIRHRWRPVLAVPYRSFGRHAVIIGSSGSGKTNLMMRLWAGWYAAASAAHPRGEGDRPLLVVLDCKGGPDARVKAVTGSWRREVPAKRGSAGWLRVVTGRRCWRQVCCPCAGRRRDRFQGAG